MNQSIEPKEPFEKGTTVPIEVIILTDEHEIKGIVHASRAIREERRISDLLNTSQKRFLAVTDAELIHRKQASSPRHYAFLQLQIDTIILLHPSTQRLVNSANYSKDEAIRFDQFRTKISKTSS